MFVEASVHLLGHVRWPALYCRKDLLVLEGGHSCLACMFFFPPFEKVQVRSQPREKPGRNVGEAFKRGTARQPPGSVQRRGLRELSAASNKRLGAGRRQKSAAPHQGRGEASASGPRGGGGKNIGSFLALCVSSMRWGHANLLCIVPILSGVPKNNHNGSIAV